MAHCNGRHCVETSVYARRDRRSCKCTCDGCSDTADDSTPRSERPPPSERPVARTPRTISSSTGAVVGGLLLLGWFAYASSASCRRKPSATADAAPTTTTAPTIAKPALRDLPIDEPVQPSTPATTTPQPAAVAAEEESTLEEIVGFWSQKMADSQNGKPDAGAMGLATEFVQKLPVWSEFMALKATDPKLVLKQPAIERGKRICVSGTISEIASEVVGGRSVAEGGMVTDGMDVVRFIAAGSTGSLVKDSYARFCGIATGRHSFENLAHTTTVGVFAVGLFDLPSNRVAAPKKPSVTAAPGGSSAQGAGKPRCHPCEPGHCPDPRDVPGCEW